MKECVHSIPLLRDIVDVRRCDKLLDEARAGTTRSDEVLGVLTSLCMSAATLTGNVSRRRLKTAIFATAFQAWTNALDVPLLAGLCLECAWRAGDSSAEPLPRRSTGAARLPDVHGVRADAGSQDCARQPTDVRGSRLMCGIFGILAHRPETVVDLTRLNVTAGVLGHRGPDHHAVFADERVGLVHTRLALVDLDARSNQPFWDSRARYCLVFNGEIYNFRQLRTELEADGVGFRTTSDTEVLLESIIHRGLDAMLPRLEGMFALYDTHEGSLTLARDRFGIKPLYVYDCDDAFAFASEIRALRPWIRFEPDVLSISSYLHGFGGPTSGHSFYRNVAIVPPGTVVVVTPGRRGCYRKFWQVQDFWQPDETARLSALKPRQIVDEVEERLFESVRMQLLADAPVGVLCSGGVDSSVITAMAARVHPNLAIFHANVPDRIAKSMPPLPWRSTSSSISKRSRFVIRTASRRWPMSCCTMASHSLPPNSVPFLMVSKLLHSNSVKAILSGEGADECYIGYPWLIFSLREFLLGLPTNVRSAYQLLRRGFARVLGNRTKRWRATNQTVARGRTIVLKQTSTRKRSGRIRSDRAAGGRPARAQRQGYCVRCCTGTMRLGWRQASKPAFLPRCEPRQPGRQPSVPHQGSGRADRAGQRASLPARQMGFSPGGGAIPAAISGSAQEARHSDFGSAAHADQPGVLQRFLCRRCFCAEPKGNRLPGTSREPGSPPEAPATRRLGASVPTRYATRSGEGAPREIRRTRVTFAGWTSRLSMYVGCKNTPDRSDDQSSCPTTIQLWASRRVA